jgi:hypothetical protein
MRRTWNVQKCFNKAEKVGIPFENKRAGLAPGSNTTLARGSRFLRDRHGLISR